MITIFDSEEGVIIVRDNGREAIYPMASAEGFAAASRAWIRAGWDAKYAYSFTWFGRPVIQLPDDLIRIQEIIYGVKPDVILETGVAHGGSLIFYATLLKAMGGGRVIGVDINIRKQNREAIEAHELSPLITLIEGDAVAPATLDRIKAFMKPTERVVVLLDSRHTKDHVLAELRSYAPLVSVGSYIVATDGVMEDLAGAPRSQPDWTWNNPKQAAIAFARENVDFLHEEPKLPFNEGFAAQRVTHWSGAFLRRVR
jgi:cephalosporin hydroxylase